MLLLQRLALLSSLILLWLDLDVKNGREGFFGSLALLHGAEPPNQVYRTGRLKAGRTVHKYIIEGEN